MTNAHPTAAQPTQKQRQSTTTHVFDRPPILDLTTNLYDGLSSPYVQISAILPTRLFFGSGETCGTSGCACLFPRSPYVAVVHIPGEHQMTSRPFKSTQNGRQILVAQQADGPSLGQSSNGTSLYRRLRGGGSIAGKFLRRRPPTLHS